MKTLIPLLAMSAGLILAAGCATLDSPSAHPKATAQVSYALPIVTPVEPDKQIQEKDGMRISVAPYEFRPQEVVRREYRRKPALLVVNNQYPVDMRATTEVEIVPRNVVFKVKVHNQLERVLRLAGSVVAFQVAGKQIAVDKANYQSFQNGIILPRQEEDYEVVGPEVSSLADNATVALFLYDIVTETDAAGNPTKRSNFEFVYKVSRRQQSKEFPSGIQSGTINQQANEMLVRLERAQGARLGDWVKIPPRQTPTGISYDLP